MALPSVAQSQLLGTTLQRVVSTFRPRSLALLGAAGGNGLELVDPGIVSRVAAIDFNPEYLEACARRHSSSFSRFEAVLHDLSQGPPVFAPVDCVYAGLVLEYLNPEPRYADLLSLVADGGVFAALVQLPSPSLPEVSDSPFAKLAQLQSAFCFVDPRRMHDSLGALGCSLISDERFDLATGKSFYFAAYRFNPLPVAGFGPALFSRDPAP
jgi:hypothetical protein